MYIAKAQPEEVIHLIKIQFIKLDRISIDVGNLFGVFNQIVPTKNNFLL